MLRKFHFVLLLLISFTSAGQNKLRELKEKAMSLVNDRPVVVLPAFFVSPETSVGLGAVAMHYYRPKKDSLSKPSNFQHIIIYTFEKQLILNNEFDVFFRQNKYWFNGKLNYYIYPYRYFGQGSDISTNQYESYSADYLEFELNSLIRWKKNRYLGPTVIFNKYFNIDSEPNGLLRTNNIPGSEPGNLLGFGLSFREDHRNNLFAPTEGYYIEGRFLQYEEKFIGNYSFTDMFLDLRKYHLIKGQWETGFQLYHQSVLGDPPFYNLSLLGNSRIMRGYYEGAYRDNHFTAVQAEIRHYIMKRFIISTFGSLGSIAHDFMDYQKLLGSYGVGIRYEINSKEHLRIRLDYARGYQSDGIYININEAF